MNMLPLELLEHELRTYKKALIKSKEAFIKGKITLCVHAEHIENLEPKIAAYKYAIRVLITYL
jgi:GTPase involved in cell partitioning and DNA repair